MRHFIADLQLQEYLQLFHENQDIAWLDKIDKRYAWLKRHLLDFEDKYGKIFPLDWDVSERITIRFCTITRDELLRIMSKRRTEIDVKLLLFAIAKTSSFELLLAKRFTGSSFALSDCQHSRNEASAFVDLIGSCFQPHLDIYTDSVDHNLSEIIERFVQNSKIAFDPNVSNSAVFPRYIWRFELIFYEQLDLILCYNSCADLFVFYKKCMVQCTQLSNGKPMYDLAMIFKKYLREYAVKLLETKIPKLTTSQTSIGMNYALKYTLIFFLNVYTRNRHKYVIVDKRSAASIDRSWSSHP